MATNQNTGAGHIIHYRGDADNKNAAQSTNGAGSEYQYAYKPGKDDRETRRRVWERYLAMRDDPIRKEEERQWELGRKMYNMWAPAREEDDWRADVTLPDGFSAIQTHLQETIDAEFRPILEAVEGSDETLQYFNNSIFQHAMNTTEFDQEVTKARCAAAMMGTAFTREEYRYETREVQDPSSYKNGKITYTKKEIIDYDDVYTRYVRPENCFFDETAEDQKYGIDCIYREVLAYDVFKQMYEGKPGFKNIDKVVPAGSLDSRTAYFQMANDMGKNDVEILHYENKLEDSYQALANNVVIGDNPLPNKHKELSLDVWSFYPVEGRIYGMGIPRIIYTLVEERRTGRNQMIDRGTLANQGMFLVNDLFDLDEQDLTPRPHGMVKINTNGLPIQQAVMPLQYGDTPISAIKMDDTLLQDEKRAHGLQDSPAMQPGSTATQAAIIKESTQRRINLINTLSAWNTLIRLGKKKWSNIQFFYPAPRLERIVQNDKWVDKPVYRTIKIPNRNIVITGDPKNGIPLQLKSDIGVDAVSRIKLDKNYARFMVDDFDVVVNAEAMAVVSKPIKQQQTNEMFDRLMNNPMLARYLDGQKATKRMLAVNDESPADWMMNDGMTDEDMAMLAQNENMLFLDMERTGKLYMIPGTPGATEAHTQVHLQFTREKVYQALSDPIKRIISNHILEENEANPATANIADLMKQGGGAAAGGAPGVDPLAALAGGGPDQGGGGNAVPAGQPGGPDAGAGQGPVPGAPVAGGDVTAGNGPAPTPAQ